MPLQGLHTELTRSGLRQKVSITCRAMWRCSKWLVNQRYDRPPHYVDQSHRRVAILVYIAAVAVISGTSGNTARPTTDSICVGVRSLSIQTKICSDNFLAHACRSFCRSSNMGMVAAASTCALALELQRREFAQRATTVNACGLTPED